MSKRDEILEVASRLYRSWYVEVISSSLDQPTWDNAPPKARDEWCLVAETALVAVREIPVPMVLTCPSCNARHIDEGVFETKPHHTHACQSCGMCWRPAIVPTIGVQFLPGFKNPTPEVRVPTIPPPTPRRALGDQHHSQALEALTKPTACDCGATTTYLRPTMSDGSGAEYCVNCGRQRS